MVRRAKAGRRRLWLAGGFAGAVAVLAAGVAFGATTIVGQADNHYAPGPYTINQGEVAQFQVLGSTHNVTAHQTGPDGGALFRSATISGGTTPVGGTQYLTAGDYTFFCSVHPATMQATLHVTGAGTPLARPAATLSLRTKTISKALMRGLLVAVNMSAKTDGVSLAATLGKATIAKASDLSTAAGQQFAVLKLTKSGKSKLRGLSKASVKLTATIPFGSPASAKGKLR